MNPILSMHHVVIILPMILYRVVTPSSNYIVRDSHELCLALLAEAQVALVSGDAFGAPNCLRLSYAASPELITEAITRLRKFLVSLQ